MKKLGTQEIQVTRQAGVFHVRSNAWYKNGAYALQCEMTQLRRSMRYGMPSDIVFGQARKLIFLFRAFDVHGAERNMAVCTAPPRLDLFKRATRYTV